VSLGFQNEDDIARRKTGLNWMDESELMVSGEGSTYLLVSGACENNALAICHTTFNVKLLPSFFLDDFFPFTFLAPLAFSQHQTVSYQ